MNTEDPRLKHAVEMEGCTDHFYLDGAGLVTIGVGCRISIMDRGAGLQMFLDDGDLASLEQIGADYETVRHMKPGLALKEYRQATRCRMRDDQIVALFNERWHAIQLEIEAYTGPISELPMPAQMGIMDMAFNVGATGVVHGFPSFTKAFETRDWATCAIECIRLENPPHSNGVQPSRNVWTADQFKSIAAE
jgi:GH24 family phage-related lysozyme (muramidase)